MTRRGWIAAGCLLLTVAACSRPNASPLPAVTPSVVSASPTTPSFSPSAAPTPSASPTPTPSTPPATPTPAPTPSATTSEPPAVQRFTLDQVAEFDDGLIVEIAGSVADKDQIVIASVRIENGTKHAYDAAPVQITATYGTGTDAPLIVDKTNELQRGFAGLIKPKDESIATVGFAVPYSQLKRVTVTVDPNDDEHDPVSFTGQVHRL